MGNNGKHKRLIMLISESKVGIHHVYQAKEDVSTFALVFVPKISRKGNFVHNLKDNKTYSKILKKYKNSSATNKDILIGYDLDETGEFMAHALQYMLIQDGVNAFSIVRTPLSEKGYLAFKNFADISSYKKYIILQEKFMDYLSSLRYKKIGFRKIIGIKHLFNFKKRIENNGKNGFVVPDKTHINLNGVSTITYITKKIIGAGYVKQ